jgi:hypothetical protein
MGQKKHKHARRTVAFYKLHHGFKEPFKVGMGRAPSPATTTAPPPSPRRRSRARALVAPHAHSRPPILLPTTPQNQQILVDGNFLHATLGAK